MSGHEKGWMTGWPERVPAYIFMLPNGAIRSNIGIHQMLMLAKRMKYSTVVRTGQSALAYKVEHRDGAIHPTDGLR